MAFVLQRYVCILLGEILLSMVKPTIISEAVYL